MSAIIRTSNETTGKGIIPSTWVNPLQHGAVFNNWAIDYLHVQMLYWVFVRLRQSHPKDFKRIIEIGSHAGFSTSALIYAKPEYLTLVEPEPTPELVSMVTRAIMDHKQLISLKMCKTSQLTHPENADYAFVDGGHSKECVIEDIHYLNNISQPPKVMVFHDTNLMEVNPHPAHAGPQWAMNMFADSGMFVLEDKVNRPTMRTHRGLAFVTEQPDYFATITMAVNEVLNEYTEYNNAAN